MNISIPCQKASEKLSQRLKETLSSSQENLMVGIPTLKRASGLKKSTTAILFSRYKF